MATLATYIIYLTYLIYDPTLTRARTNLQKSKNQKYVCGAQLVFAVAFFLAMMDLEMIQRTVFWGGRGGM